MKVVFEVLPVADHRVALGLLGQVVRGAEQTVRRILEINIGIHRLIQGVERFDGAEIGKQQRRRDRQRDKQHQEKGQPE